MDKQEFLNLYLTDRKGTDCMKWDGLEEKFGETDLTAMWIADMEFRAPDAVLDVIAGRIRHGIFGYSMVPDDYYRVFSDWMGRRYHFPVKKSGSGFRPGA